MSIPLEEGKMKNVLVASLCVCFISGSVLATITWSGDVDPADPSTWDSSTTGIVGNTGDGTMDITGGSDVIDEYGIIGYDADTTGAVTVDGTNSTWTNNGNLIVGYEGNGTLNITGGGAVSNDHGIIGSESGTTGDVTVDGSDSTWTNNGTLYVGLRGDGTVNITDGGTVSSIGGGIGNGHGTTGAVTVDGSGSTWINSSNLVVGSRGNGALNITGGGAVSSLEGNIGFFDNSTGKVIVDGSGSTWTITYNILVGYRGKGTLNITNGGGVVSNTKSSIGRESGSTGEVTVDGAGSTWTNIEDLIVGQYSNGTLNITGGGLVSVAGTLTFGDVFGDGDGFINMATGGKLALFGEADDSLVEFMGLINFVNGTGAIRYWNSSISDWADITGATYGLDYTLDYLTAGDLAGFTMLTVGEIPEPATMLLLALGGVLLRKRKA